VSVPAPVRITMVVRMMTDDRLIFQYCWPLYLSSSDLVCMQKLCIISDERSKVRLASDVSGPGAAEETAGHGDAAEGRDDTVSHGTVANPQSGPCGKCNISLPYCLSLHPPRTDHPIVKSTLRIHSGPAWPPAAPHPSSRTPAPACGVQTPTGVARPRRFGSGSTRSRRRKSATDRPRQGGRAAASSLCIIRMIGMRVPAQRARVTSVNGR
jgi:hypothetical protein